MPPDLCEIFEYDNGQLIWKVRPEPHVKNTRGCRLFDTRFAGKTTGIHNASGYLKVGFSRKVHAIHRIIWQMHDGIIPSGYEIDHINHVKTDNRLENLRRVTRAKNSRNLPARKNNTSGTCGVLYRSEQRKFQARIKINGKNLHPGYF